MITHYLNYVRYEKRYSSLTAASYEKTLLQFEDFLISLQTDLATATRKHIRFWIIELVEEGLNAKTINLKISVLRSFFKYLNRTKMVIKNPTEFIYDLKTAKLLPRFIDQDNLNYLLDNLEFVAGFKGQRDKAILELLYGTGIRLSELLQLKDFSFNPFRSSIKVIGKGRKERYVPLYPGLCLLMTDYLTVKEQKYPGIEYLFLNDRGKPFCAASLYRLVKKYLSLIVETGQRSPHTLRHSFATDLMNNGANVIAIRDLLGHETARATETYTHVATKFISKNYKKGHPKG